MKTLAILIGSLVLAATARAETVLHVSPDAPGHYHLVQAAIDALPATGGTIDIAPGRYREKLKVTGDKVTLHGEGASPSDVVLVYGDSAASTGSTFRSATLDVTGDDLHLDNLTVANDYGDDPAHSPSQAIALSMTGDREVVRRVRILGHQDTLFVNKGPGGRMARAYFDDCYVSGHVDFVFGNAKAYFDRCELHGVAHQQVMYTAQSRNAPDEDSAFVFHDCVLTADPAATEISLGRPWRAYAAVIFLDTRIETVLAPGGWTEWTPGKTDRLPTAYYAERGFSGPGARSLALEPHAHRLSAAAALRGGEHMLWYAQPARSWVEALPVGNGRLGAMVFGGTDHERLQLNEDTFWQGGPYDPVNPEAKANLPKVRELIFAGRYAEAEQ